MKPEDRSLLAELTICLVTLTEAAARIGLDMRQEGAGIIAGDRGAAVVGGAAHDRREAVRQRVAPGPGDIANDHGDICVIIGKPPISEGLISLPFTQAFSAMAHGWRIKAMDDLDYVAVQRGGPAWKSRRP